MRLLMAMAERRFNFVDVVNSGQLSILVFTGFYWRGLIVWVVISFLSVTLEEFAGKPL